MKPGRFVPEALTVTPPDVATRGRLLGRGTGGVMDAGDPFGQSAPPGFPPTQRTLLAFPAEIYPIPDAQQFRVRASFNSPGVGLIEPAALVFNLSPNNIGVIRLVGFGVLNLLVGSDIGWSLWIDNEVESGFEDLGFFQGAVPRITSTEDTLVYVPQGARISIKFRNTDGAAYTAYANYEGWQYTPEAAERWGGQGGGEG